jgi:hypothetical protein
MKKNVLKKSFANTWHKYSRKWNVMAQNCTHWTKPITNSCAYSPKLEWIISAPFTETKSCEPWKWNRGTD